MGLFVAVLFQFLFVAVILTVFYFAQKRSLDEQGKILELQALKRNGTVKKSTFLSYPQLHLPGETGEVLVYSRAGGKNSPPYTYVIGGIVSVRDYTLKIRREHKIFGVGTVFGQDIKMGNPDFDEAFIVRGNDEMVVREYLTGEIQMGILGLKKYDPGLEINKNKLMFFITDIPKDEGLYDQVIDVGLMLINRAREIG